MVPVDKPTSSLTPKVLNQGTGCRSAWGLTIVDSFEARRGAGRGSLCLIAIYGWSVLLLGSASVSNWQRDDEPTNPTSTYASLVPWLEKALSLKDISDTHHHGTIRLLLLLKTKRTSGRHFGQGTILVATLRTEG